MRNEFRTHSKLAGILALALVQLVVVACDKVPLMAPRESTVTVRAAAETLPAGGSTEVTAFVAESSGTPVQNGTVVRFTTNLGRVDPVEAQTRNGLAVTTFVAGDVSGVAGVRATSGGVGSATGGTTPSNEVSIKVGAAAVDSILLRASTQFVPFEGGNVELVATVQGELNRILSGIPVAFSSTEGTLSQTLVITDSAGEARTQLTTKFGATAKATAGTKEATVTITRREPPPIPVVGLTAASATATSLGQLWTFTATVTGNDNETRPTKFEWSFGDDSRATSTTGVQAHVYTAGNVLRDVSVKVTLANGATVEATTQIIIPALPLPVP